MLLSDVESLDPCYGPPSGRHQASPHRSSELVRLRDCGQGHCATWHGQDSDGGETAGVYVPQELGVDAGGQGIVEGV